MTVLVTALRTFSGVAYERLELPGQWPHPGGLSQWCEKRFTMADGVKGLRDSSGILLIHRIAFKETEVGPKLGHSEPLYKIASFVDRRPAECRATL